MMEDLSLHILDIAENAAAAGATRVRIAVNENERRDVLTIRVSDNGRGMSAEERARALDPFFTTGRKRTGLGLPLLAQTAAACGGRLAIDSAPGRGTRVIARFSLSHVDRPPLSRMAETLMTVCFGHSDLDVHYRHTRNGCVFSMLWRAPGAGAVDAAALAALRDSLRTGLRRIGAS